jgi:topoisomerase IA-like protein
MITRRTIFASLGLALLATGAEAATSTKSTTKKPTTHKTTAHKTTKSSTKLAKASKPAPRPLSPQS